MKFYVNTFSTIALAFVLSAPAAVASGTHEGGHGTGIGQPGKVADADRTISVSMTEMRYDPAKIEVAEGETITFVISNDGRMVHEFNLGTDDMWDGHAGEMRTMLQKGMMTLRRLHHGKMRQAGMMHDDPNSVLLEPGETAEITWTFSKAGEMGFACNVPGHREGGMVGKVVFEGG